MCITFYHTRIPDSKCPYKLVLAMNRDEFLNRPTAAACWKDDILAGWDLEKGREGGTWLACDKLGRVAFLTNIFTGGGADPQAKGRGHLVVDYLKNNVSAESYLKAIAEDHSKYNPFNLVLLEPEPESGLYSIWQYTRGLQGHTNSFGPVMASCGTYGVSNHPLDCSFRKSRQGRKILEHIVKYLPESNVDQVELVKELEALLKTKDKNHPDEQMLKQSHVIGKPCRLLEYAESRSSIFVQLENMNYGTRTHTIITIDLEDNVTFQEETLDKNGVWNKSHFNFSIEKKDRRKI